MQFCNAILIATLGAAVAFAPCHASDGPGTEAASSAASSPAESAGTTAAVAPSKLPAGTAVVVMTNEELSTKANKAGDKFHVTVLHDLMDGETIVVPKGTIGTGEVTFATNNGGFGKPGILSISLRHLELNGAKVQLDGRYREEGANKNGATAATWFAVGVFSGFIRGKPGVIPKGRELKARTGEDIAFSPATPSTSAGDEAAPAKLISPKAETPPVAPMAGSNDPKTGGFE